jgi:hypothetical protein
MDSFIYKWTDNKTGMFYIGIHKGTPDDGYICSSKYMMEEYRKRPADFHRDILEYGTQRECQIKEKEYLKSVDAAKNLCYYNRSNGVSPYQNYGPLSEESKEKIRLSKIGKKRPPRSEEWSRKISESNKGKVISEETKKKMSLALKGKPGNRKGSKLSEEHKQALKKSRLGKEPWNKGKTWQWKNK